MARASEEPINPSRGETASRCSRQGERVTQAECSEGFCGGRRIFAAPHSSIVPVQFILPTTRKTVRQPPWGVDTPHGFAVISPPQQAGAPTQVCCDRSRPSKDRRLPMAIVSTDSRQENSRQPFRRSHSSPAPPAATLTSPHCLAGNIAQAGCKLPLAARSTVYSGHTPSPQRLNHSECYLQAPVTTPAAAGLPALVITFTLRLTSLSRVTGRNSGRMSSSPEPA